MCFNSILFVRQLILKFYGFKVGNLVYVHYICWYKQFQKRIGIFFYINKPKFSKDKKKIIKTIDISFNFLEAAIVIILSVTIRISGVLLPPIVQTFKTIQMNKKAISVYILIFSVELMAAVSSTSYVTLLYLIWIALTLHAKFTPF